MSPFMSIAVGLLVLALGRRLAVLGAAVGFLLGIGILHLFPGLEGPWMDAIIPAGLAVLGFVGGLFAKGFEAILALVVGALGGAAIVLGFLDLFRINNGTLDWLFAFAGGLVGLLLARNFRDWAMIILAGLIGGLLVVRGLAVWLPVLEGWLGTVLLLALVGGSLVFQRRSLDKSKAASPAPAR